jgi:cell division septation protein DedD
MSFLEYVILIFAMLMLIGWLVGIARVVGGIVDIALGVNQRPREKSRREVEQEEVQALLAELKQEREERELAAQRDTRMRTIALHRQINRNGLYAQRQGRDNGRPQSSASGNPFRRR